ncbi:MAG: hypothetical protein QF362_03930 [Candidatus Woesearchaeota archaeon]|jgi:hypothetical protein|nr:hypothetical protein [Candidatus Woesearchaeota archaeon]
MISIERQQKLLLNVSRRLKKPVTMYAIGGTAMMFLGFKEATLDIDLVFEKEEDRTVFKEAVKDIGYHELDSIEIYGAKRNQPLMLRLDDERFDLFLVNVIDFIFSKQMMKRAEKTHQFNNNLILKVADPHDIILMKCATDRMKDIDDARNIIKEITIDFKVIIEEARNQIELGRQSAAFELGEFLENLKKTGVKIPQKVLDELFKIVKKQAEEKVGKKAI